jgi:hypothetical protein
MNVLEVYIAMIIQHIVIQNLNVVVGTNAFVVIKGHIAALGQEGNGVALQTKNAGIFSEIACVYLNVRMVLYVILNTCAVVILVGEKYVYAVI